MNKTNLESLQANIQQLITNQREKPFTFIEACGYLNLSKSYLYKLTSKGEIGHYKPNGKKIYFTKANLDSWLLRKPILSNIQIEQKANDYIQERGN
jgi:excisionase family DNA binding protein